LGNKKRNDPNIIIIIIRKYRVSVCVSRWKLGGGGGGHTIIAGFCFLPREEKGTDEVSKNGVRQHFQGQDQGTKARCPGAAKEGTTLAAQTGGGEPGKDHLVHSH
jgi:hypothetical protein